MTALLGSHGNADKYDEVFCMNKNSIKKLIISLVFAVLLCTVCAHAAVYMEDFTVKSNMHSLQNGTLTAGVTEGKFRFDFSGMEAGVFHSRYMCTRYTQAKDRLYFEFDFKVSDVNNSYIQLELRNYDNNVQGSGVTVGSIIPLTLSNGTLELYKLKKQSFTEEKGTFAIDTTITDGNVATVKTYINGELVNTYTRTGFKFESQTEFQYRIKCGATAVAEGTAPTIDIDNIKTVIDEDQIPVLYAGETQYLYDFGDNRFISSDNTFKYNKVKTVRQIANFTRETKTLTNIVAQKNDKNTYSKTGKAKLTELTLAPGEVILVETEDTAPDVNDINSVENLIWNNTQSISPVFKKSRASAAIASAPLPEELAVMLKQNGNTHPRLLTTEGEIEKVGGLLETDAHFAGMYNALTNWKSTHDSGGFLSCAMPKYGSNTGNIADIIYNRAIVWGYLYQASGDEAYAKLLADSMRVLTEYPDWYYKKQNFLVTTHIATAMSVGYDFIYDYLCREENIALRDAICESIYTKAVLPGLEIYREDISNNWQRRPDNWNMICNGGIGISCLTIGHIDKYASECSIALNYALRSLDYSMSYFGEDGAWVEGLGYYGYMFTMGADFIASLNNTFGTAFGYMDYSGYAQSGYSLINLAGSKYVYNYSDADPGITKYSPALAFFAKWFGKNDLGYARYKQIGDKIRAAVDGTAAMSSLKGVYSAKDLIWYSPEFKNIPSTVGKDGYDSEYGLILDKVYADVGMVAIHDNYSENQVFVAANYGKNKDYHTHIDMGSFVYEADGEQWFVDLGLNNYSLADCFNKQYYRLKPEGHNCVVFNPDAASYGQIHESEGSLSDYSFADDASWFVMDISNAYADYAQSYKRLIYCDKNTQGFAVKDKFNLNGEDNQYYWFAHTPAQISISDDGKTAILTKSNGKKLKAVLESDGVFTAMAAERLYPVPENLKLDADPENTGITKLCVYSDDAGGECEIVVKAVPLDENDEGTLPDISKITF